MAKHEIKNSTLYSQYLEVLDKGDPRVAEWMWMDTPVTTGAILLFYLLALRGIQFYMKDKKPYNLKWLLVIYNAVQVVGSFYVFYEILTVAIQSKYSLTCEPVDYSTDPLPMRMLSAMWWFYFSKAVDLFDTMFFALRKKSNQITFLHVFHHLTMFPYGWFGLKYVGGGQTFFLCMFNSFVHTVMYSYYALSAIGPHMQPYLWWKKYLTQLQLVQFFAVMAHSIANYMAEDCAFPKKHSLGYLAYGFVITLFFANFYIQSYIKNRNDKQANANAKKDK